MSLIDTLRILGKVWFPRIIEARVPCPGCGQPFQCGASLWGCWCREVKLADAARAELKQLYSGCLCRACLERAAEKPNLPAPESGG